MDKDVLDKSDKQFVKVNYKGKIFYLSYSECNKISGFSYTYYGFKLISINKNLTAIKKSKLLHKFINELFCCNRGNIKYFPM